MALDPNRWTLKTQEALNHALESARANANPEVTPDHLLVALLGQDEGVVLPILAKVGQAPLPVRNRGRGGRRPAAQGLRQRRPHEPGAHRRCSTRPTPPARELHDEYLSTEHLLLALADQPRRRPRGPAGRPGRRCGAATASPARTPRSSTRRSRSTAATSPRRPAPARSTRSSAATTRSAASSRCCRGAPRTTRCSSASPASARPPSSRAWPGASSRATCPRA